jgi:hypothetical protein
MRRSVEVRTRWSKRVSVTARSHAETTVDWLLGLSWVSKALGKRSGHDDKVNESLSACTNCATLVPVILVNTTLELTQPRLHEGVLMHA